MVSFLPAFIYLLIEYSDSMYNIDHFRETYGRLKDECQRMVPVIGSGKYITTPIVTDDGQPIDGSTNGAKHDVSDKKVIQWKLFLHQIGTSLFPMCYKAYIFG